MRDGVEPLAVGAARRSSTSRAAYAAEGGQDPRGAVDGVDAQPAAGAVRPAAGDIDLGPQGALAAALDLAVRGLEQDREVAVEPAPALPRHPAEPVLHGLDLLVVVEDERQVVRGLGPGDAEAAGQPQHDGVPGLHVGGAAPVEQVAVEPARDVVGDRHRVEVAGEDDAGRPAQVRAGEHGVADPLDLQAAERTQRRLDRVGQPLLVAGDRRGVDQRAGQLQDVGGQVQLR